MSDLGAEVGQKMRAAIKAKLMEIGSYVDDELPDYIMVMVANKRTKSQMEEDLQLFLRTNTSVFVDWLQQVLKKLKQVTVTNPDLYAASAIPELKPIPVIKKEKKEKQPKPSKRQKTDTVTENFPVTKSLTDDLPIQATKLVEKRHLSIKLEKAENSVLENNNRIVTINDTNVDEDSFDIPLLSEVSQSDKNDFDDDCINLATDADELGNELIDLRNIEESLNPSLPSSKRRSPIRAPEPTPPKSSNRTQRDRSERRRKNILERLGSRRDRDSDLHRKRRISPSETAKEDNEILNKTVRSRVILEKDGDKKEKRLNALKRLGLPSSVVALSKTEPVKESVSAIPSVVKVKPRSIPPPTLQANNKLLLKAVAEAQKSVTQVTISHKDVEDIKRKIRQKPESKKYEKPEISTRRKLAMDSINKVKNLIIEVAENDKKPYSKSMDKGDQEYAPAPTHSVSERNVDDGEYIPDSFSNEQGSEKHESDIRSRLDEPKLTTNQRFIVTLDGITRNPLKLNSKADTSDAKESLGKKRAPSPIVFKKNDENTPPIKKPALQKPLSDYPVLALKPKERCKYWPGCKLGVSCEFIHPSTLCKMFPQCKFGDKCLYVHPNCKFDSACTRRDCPFMHALAKPNSIRLPIQPPSTSTTMQVCKYYPNCSNPNCLFFHPRACKFGKYCLNQTECSFFHGQIPTKDKLKWHSSC